MAIDDNANYTLTGAQVKDLASKVKASDPLIIYTSAAIGNAFQTYSDDNLTVVITGAQIGAAFKAGRQIILTTDTILEPTATIVAFTEGPEDMFTCVVENTTYRYGYKSAQSRWVAVSRTVNDGTLTIQHNGTTVQTFTANQSTNATANVETIYADPIASTSALTPPVQTNMIADGAVTAAKIDLSTMYVSAPTPASNVAVNNTKTDIQSITLGAGKWRVCWGYRYAHSTSSTKYVETGLRRGTTDLLSSATNVPVDGNGDCRVLISQSMEVNPTGTVTYSSWINNAPANTNGNCPNTSCYLYALRIG